VAAGAAARIHERLADEAVEAVLERPQDPRLSGHGGSMVLNGAYLVARTGEERFRGVLEDLATEYEPDGLRLVLSGPWPAHHFTGGAAG
jgi:hypothetical protein